MTLTEIKTQIDNFGKRKQQQIEEYGNKQKELAEKVENNEMYQTEANLRLEDIAKAAKNYSDTEYNSIISKIEAIEQTELDAIKAGYETVTADNLAELTLLGQTKVTEKELLSYLEKYKRNPLAIKKLHEIAFNNGISLPEYVLKEDRLNNLLQLFKQYAKSYHDTSINDAYGAASDLAFTLVLSTDEMTKALEEYSKHFDTALGLSQV
jgi:raw score 8.11